MDMSFSSTAPARLYALALKLRPLQYGTLMPFSGELVHGAWLHWLKQTAPEVATWLHDGNRRRFFTCSSLLFPLSPYRMLEAERENTHLPLDPAKVYTLRITLLLGELFPLFYDTLLNFNKQEGKGVRPPFILIGKQHFLLEEVVMDNNEASGWTGFTSIVELSEKVKQLKLGNVESLRLEFASLTTFNRSNTKRGYGTHYARLPLPMYVFPGLVRRWEDIAPPEMVGWVQRERIEQYIQEDGVIVADYDLKTHHVRFTTHVQQGFIGTCKYHLRGPDEETSQETPLTVRQQLLLLAYLAFYCGIGYKTSMGMGRTRII
ncbi:CRISPR system precrRNA processing endoribonuclease RAMP protein Cas6 [Ktedonosporobacter rubrisoli]|uniref:CRISPR system precrRNA processing endoribonuclease RAMP protein Cas6 n=1 Tax=Ktedonosporobacter rubrisoli TaxID=2509675 RepID=A0A4V0Z038_KTERU|nr:CRISPR system precrRNA processing endoribonuclease RAMP protein Cas6 [Ktedonosporobacter rubrisoli]QBD81871.1 CRISPR system precrRNA processing endoribonuclease RAMP protein Cas6 [Ktedonosporobacter rubrisoli]